MDLLSLMIGFQRQGSNLLFFDGLLNPVNNSWAEDFGIPKNKLNKKIVKKSIKKYRYLEKLI